MTGSLKGPTPGFNSVFNKEHTHKKHPNSC
jgi:hypothetical protein